MKKYLLFVVILVLSLLSCSKEDMKVHDSQQEQISFAAGRLSFASSQKFVNCIETLKNYYYDDLKYEKKLESIIGKKNFIAFKKLAYKKNGTVDSLDFEEDTLVNDPVFRSLLNHKYEIEVEGTIYKITPFGTFAFKPDKYEKVLAIIQLLEEQKQISEVQLSNYLYQVDTGIIRYDTFKEIEDNTILVSEAQVAKNGHLKNSVNDDIITYYIDKKQTIVGEFLQNTFGISKKIIRSHSSKRRFYFSLSSPNYIVLTYVSVAIGFQKENWIGWSKTTADKMVLGWDGLIIKTNVSMTLPEKPKFDEFGNLYWSKAETQPYFSPYTYAVIYLPEYNTPQILDHWLS